MLKPLTTTMFRLCWKVCTFLLLLTTFFATIDADDFVRPKRSDDTPNAALQAMMEHQAALIQSLQAEVMALKTQVGSLAKTVAFTVRFKADSGTGLAIPKQAVLRFDDVVYNAGDGYEPQTGIFTAPLAGTYSFFLNKMGHAQGNVAVVKEGAVLELVWSSGDTDQGTSLMTTHLGVGDRVWVLNRDGAAIRGSYYTVFTGFLLRAD